MSLSIRQNKKYPPPQVPTGEWGGGGGRWGGGECMCSGEGWRRSRGGRRDRVQRDIKKKYSKHKLITTLYIKTEKIYI